MRIRRHSLVAAVLLLIPTVARAHDHTADFFAGLSFAHASSLWGIHQSLAITSDVPSNRDLSFVGDFSFDVGEHDGQDLTRAAFMGGARYTVTGERLLKHLISAHLLVGGVRDAGAQADNDWALAVGGGWEYLPGGDQSAGGFGFRVQADYVKNLSGGDSFSRYSAGVVYRVRRP